MTPKERARLRRIAREAANSWVGRHWPNMAELRRDGMGSGLVEDNEHEAAIRRFVSTFSPSFVLSVLDDLPESHAECSLPDPGGHS